MQLKIRRSSPKRNRTKQALIAAGSIALAAETVRRVRHRHRDDADADASAD